LKTTDLGYSIEKCDESPGVYYENKGMANLYNVEWKTIVYVNLNGASNETLVLRQYLHHTDVLCQTAFTKNWAGCTLFITKLGKYSLVDRNNGIT
jgi:hypothetical protein